MKATLLRRAAAWVAALVFLLPCVPALAGHDVVIPFPEELTIRMESESWTAADGRQAEADLPVTCQESVNQALRAALEEIWQELQAHSSPDEVLELSSTFRISGESWAGFLLTGRAIRTGRSRNDTFDTEETVYLTSRIFSYDLLDGAPLSLRDVFPEGSMVWQMISRAIEERFALYYPDTSHDGAAIRQLANTASLADLPFLPCAGRFLLTFPLEDALDGKWQLVQVPLLYRDYREFMIAEAERQTDNSARPIIALTYDDGPVLNVTRTLLRNLDRYGASATFFCVGTQVEKWPDMARRELDYGHTVGSHTMDHTYAEDVHAASQLLQDREQVLALHAAQVGPEPVLFRAPGGNYAKYQKHEVGWPLIQWSSSAGDTGKNTERQLARHLTANAEDGSILLLHDIYMKTAVSAEEYLAEFYQRGFLTATVEELLSLAGLEPEPNEVYVSVPTAFTTGGIPDGAL